MPSPAKRTRIPRIPYHPGIRLASQPSDAINYPWRFTLGEWVFIRGFASEKTFQIRDGFIHKGMPHLIVRSSYSGGTWRIPQLHASSSPIASLS